jgi:hypothetical protein
MGTWSLTTATLLPDGRVLITGGLDPSADSQTRTAELYDARTGGWSVTGAMATARASHTAVMSGDGGVVVVIGGFRDGVGALASTEEYTPATGSWTGGPVTPTPHAAQATAKLPDGRVLVAGGRSGAGATASTVICTGC